MIPFPPFSHLLTFLPSPFHLGIALSIIFHHIAPVSHGGGEIVRGTEGRKEKFVFPQEDNIPRPVPFLFLLIEHTHTHVI